MEKIVTILLIFIMTSCGTTDDTPLTDSEGEDIAVLIAPIQTNNGYLSTEKEHYVVKNNIAPLNKLLLFIGGSFSTPNSYSRICDHAASLGLDVISLSYPNNVPAAVLGASTDPLIFDKYRNEICFGIPDSEAVNVDALNSINSRTINLLQYLEENYPDQNWGQYLNSSNTLSWEKIIVSRHSQGAGHACFLAKKNTVSRVVMFFGPNDYSTFFNEPANWLVESGATNLNKHFSLLHEQDEVVPFNNQLSNLRALGLLSTTENPIIVDDLVFPYENANSLSLFNITGISYHNVPIGTHSILPDIWTYMFTN